MFEICLGGSWDMLRKFGGARSAGCLALCWELWLRVESFERLLDETQTMWKPTKASIRLIQATLYAYVHLVRTKFLLRGGGWGEEAGTCALD